LAESSYDNEGNCSAELVLSLAREKKLNRYNDRIQSRRPEFYSEISIT